MILPSASAPAPLATFSLPGKVRQTVYSVKSYGAKGDGTTDDTTAIQNAINAASSAGGGTVYLPPGAYVISAALVPANNVWIRGDSMFTTRITTVASANFAIFDNYNSHTPGNPWTKGTISDLELDGSNMNNAVPSKGINSKDLVDCKFTRIYCHDTTATGLGADDFYSVTITECIVVNCGYSNTKTITAASWSGNTITFTTSQAHGYTAGSSKIVITGMVPAGYNGLYVVTSVTNSTTFTVGTSNNSTSYNLNINPGTATTFGVSSDQLIGHNGIGVASGAQGSESMVVTNNFCIRNQNNNYLIEADTNTTGPDASYIFANNYSESAGNVGFQNTGTPNVQFKNNFDYGSWIGAQTFQVSQSVTITAASWATNVATYTTSSAHGYSVGQYVTISGMTPSGYNGYFAITSVTSTTFTVAMTVNPGTATVFGSSQTVVHQVYGTSFNDNIFVNNIIAGVKVQVLAEGVMVKNNTIAGCYVYGINNTGAGSFQVTGNRIYGCGWDGIYVTTGNGSYNTPSHIDISNNHIYNNSQSSSTHDGIDIDPATNSPMSDITVRGNHFYDTQPTKTQRYGLILRNNGTMSNVLVSENDFNTNKTGALLVQNTSTSIVIKSNFGYNPVGDSAITVTASPFTYTNGSSPADIYISGGTVSSIVKGGITLFALTNTSVHLEPNQSLTVTYSVAPTMTTDVY